MNKPEFKVFLNELARRLPVMGDKVLALPPGTKQFWWERSFQSLEVQDAIDALDELFSEGGLDKYATIDKLPQEISTRAKRIRYAREGKSLTTEAQEQTRAASIRNSDKTYCDHKMQKMLAQVQDKMKEEKASDGDLIHLWTEEASREFDSEPEPDDERRYRCLTCRDTGFAGFNARSKKTKKWFKFEARCTCDKGHDLSTSWQQSGRQLNMLPPKFRRTSVFDDFNEGGD